MKLKRREKGWLLAGSSMVVVDVEPSFYSCAPIGGGGEADGNPPCRMHGVREVAPDS